MSRSYKHTPRAGDKKDKYYKRYANKRLRKSAIEEIYKYKSYRKYTNTWEICDYEDVGASFEDYWQSMVSMWNRWGRFYGVPYPNKEQEYQKYCRYYLRK